MQMLLFAMMPDIIAAFLEDLRATVPTTVASTQALYRASPCRMPRPSCHHEANDSVAALLSSAAAPAMHLAQICSTAPTAAHTIPWRAPTSNPLAVSLASLADAADDDATIMAFLGSLTSTPSLHAEAAAPKLLEEVCTLVTTLQMEAINTTNHVAVKTADNFLDAAHVGSPSHNGTWRALAASTAATSIAVQALVCPPMISAVDTCMRGMPDIHGQQFLVPNSHMMPCLAADNDIDGHVTIILAFLGDLCIKVFDQPILCKPLPVGDPAPKGGVTTPLFDGRGAIVPAPTCGAAFSEDEVGNAIAVIKSYSFPDSDTADPAIQNFLANVLPTNKESAAHIGATLNAAEAIVITAAENDTSTLLPHKPAFAEGPFLSSSTCPCKDGASSNSFCVQCAAIHSPQANRVHPADDGGVDVLVIINATSARQLLLSHQSAAKFAASSTAIAIVGIPPPTSTSNKKPKLLPVTSLLSTWILITFDPGGHGGHVDCYRHSELRPSLQPTPFDLGGAIFNFHLNLDITKDGFKLSFRLRGRMRSVQTRESMQDADLMTKSDSKIHLMKSTLDPG